jgi:hypothetical protein
MATSAIITEVDINEERDDGLAAENTSRCAPGMGGKVPATAATTEIREGTCAVAAV